MTRQLGETRFAGDIQLEREDNGYRLTATGQDRWQRHWRLLSRSSAIAMRAPQALREKLLESPGKGPGDAPGKV